MAEIGTKRKFSEEEKNKMAELYKDGMSLRNIAIEYNTTKGTVKNNIKHLVEFRPKSKIELKEVQEEVIRMYFDGMSLKNIGTKLNLSYYAVKKFLKEKELIEIDVEDFKYNDILTDILNRVYEGLPLSKIADEFGISKSIISNYVNYLNKIPEGYYDKNRKYSLKKEFFTEDFYKNPFEIGFLIARAIYCERGESVGVDFYSKKENKEIFEEIISKFTDKTIIEASNSKGINYKVDIISKDVYTIFKNIEEDKTYIQKFIDLGLGKQFFKGYILSNKTILVKKNGTKYFYFSFRKDYIFDMFLEFIKNNDIELYKSIERKIRINKIKNNSLILYKKKYMELINFLSED